MHHCHNVDEVLRFLACEPVASEFKATTIALASRKNFEDPVSDALWEAQGRLLRLHQFVSLLAVFSFSPPDCPAREVFRTIPTKAEWSCFRK